MMGDGSDDVFLPFSRDVFWVDSYGALGVPDFKSQGMLTQGNAGRNFMTLSTVGKMCRSEEHTDLQAPVNCKLTWLESGR